MGADRVRVMLAGAATLALMIASTLVLDWFVIKIPGLQEMGLDLRTAHGCTEPGLCASVSLSKIGGLYPTLSKIAFFSGLAFAASIALAAGRMLLTEDRSPSIWTKLAYAFGGLTFFSAFSAGYLFAPSMGASNDMMMAMIGGTIEIERTLAPVAMLLSVVAGFATIWFTRMDSSTTAIGTPVTNLPPARVVAAPSAPLPVRRDATPSPTVPPPLRGKIRFAVKLAEITRGGIDARRDDNSSVLVMWRDVIGAVARRLPQELDGITFVDVVSSAGATLRLLPWTKLSLDEAIDDSTDARRALALLAVITKQCPDITLDPATRKFIEQKGEAAQLPDLATLAAHDERLS